MSGYTECPTGGDHQMKPGLEIEGIGLKEYSAAKTKHSHPTLGIFTEVYYDLSPALFL